MSLLLSNISALSLSVGLMLSVLPHIDKVYGQQNQTGDGNMTSTQQPHQKNRRRVLGQASEIENLSTGNIPMVGNETSGSIREAIAEPEQFLENITEKVTASDTVKTIVNGTSDVLGLR